MRDADYELLKKAALFVNRNWIVRLDLCDGDILHAHILCMPCECGECNNLLIYEHVWSSCVARQVQWEKEKGKVGGHAIPIDLIESVHLISRS